MSKISNNNVLKRTVFFAGLISWYWSAPCLSVETGMDVTLNANIVENTCQISIPGDGKVHLPIVSKSWFYNGDGSSRLQPTDAAAGTEFSVKVESCSTGSTINKLNFSFQPQSQQWPVGSRQVFINETAVAEGGADNTGVVIFSKELNTNVLNSDGSSSVLLDAGATDWAKEYQFYARLQNTGPVASGKVTSRVVVNATYR
ncbi:fimbrial-like protein [Enterobacter oligotrophicus]|uniref:fimbrial-like protein n=1 Tax=Enterobacter oligotrophicus TaxID=2478464 RepID=UPI0012608F28|nr:fimbrial-like protein [Enterobacter oligotrophicus]